MCFASFHLGCYVGTLWYYGRNLAARDKPAGKIGLREKIAAQNSSDFSIQILLQTICLCHAPLPPGTWALVETWGRTPGMASLMGRRQVGLAGLNKFTEFEFNQLNH